MLLYVNFCFAGKVDQQRIPGSSNRRTSMFTGEGRSFYGRLSSPREASTSARSVPAFGDGGAEDSGGSGPGGPRSNDEIGFRGLKYLGTLYDAFGEESVEIYLGSFHQQALIAEAKRVLSQQRNKGLGVELMGGVAAVGVGRNSIGAIITTTRPYKKVEFLA